MLKTIALGLTCKHIWAYSSLTWRVKSCFTVCCTVAERRATTELRCRQREREREYHSARPSLERERLQCFSQPTSLITYRRRQMSNLEEIETTQNKLENPHVILLRKKGPHMFVENKEAYCCLSGWRAGHSKTMCSSSATATPPQCVHTLLALATCWPQQNGPLRLATCEKQV